MKDSSITKYVRTIIFQGKETKLMMDQNLFVQDICSNNWAKKICKNALVCSLSRHYMFYFNNRLYFLLKRKNSVASSFESISYTKICCLKYCDISRQVPVGELSADSSKTLDEHNVRMHKVMHRIQWDHF